jgi:hypothetical protein
MAAGLTMVFRFPPKVGRYIEGDDGVGAQADGAAWTSSHFHQGFSMDTQRDKNYMKSLWGVR